MISVRNRLPLLSGNRRLLVIATLLFAASCSPKLQPATQPAPPPLKQPVAKNKPVEKPPVKLPPPASVISLILPFGLDHLNPGESYNVSQLQQANLSVDYYQGFKLALDSLTARGFNYKLQLFDTKDAPSQAHALAYNPDVKGSDLIVGPVFPESIKPFVALLAAPRKPIVSPLSPAEPTVYNNQNIVTVIPPLDEHALAAATYINKAIKPKKIFVLKSGYSEDNEYTIPFKKAIDSLSKKGTTVVQLTVARGQLTSILPQLSTIGPNVFVVPSTNQAFLMVTLRSLDSLAAKYPVVLFGHPSWEKFAFLKAELLQRLQTHITCADRVNYKSAAALIFLRSYRKTYHIEPTEYAIKGFDEGLYFGQLLGANNGSLTKLAQTDFTGLHNSFHFINKPGLGWVNTHVNVLKYANFELKQVE